MSAALRVFLAHPKDADPRLLVEQLQRQLTARGVNATVTPGAEDHARRFAQDGGWNGWCQSVATGKSYFGMNLEPRFHVIVVAPARVIGKATADITQQALRAGKPVRFFDGEALLAPVAFVNVRNSADYNEGWEVVVNG